MTLDCFYQKMMKKASKTDDPAERLLCAVILRAVVDYSNPLYRTDVERFFQNGFVSGFDINWIKEIQTIGGKT